MRSGRTHIVAYEDEGTLERLASSRDTLSLNPDREMFLKQALINYGLCQEEVEVILDKMVSNLSFADIARRHHFTSRQTAEYTYRTILRKLKDRGFKL